MGSSVTSILANSYFWYAVALCLAGYVTYNVVYNRFFHPLAKVPGPFLPAVTYWYQSFYNARFYLEIERLHNKYGPVVRITPDEVHLSDPENYDKIYYMGTKYWKSPRFYNAFCIPHATFSTPPNDLHKHRRAMLNPFFSRKMVLEMEEVVQDKARKLVRLMQNGIDENKPVDLHHGFRAVSVDVITDFSFAQSYNILDTPDLGDHFFRMVRGIGPAMWAFQQIPSLQKLALKTPPWLAPYLSEPLGHVTELQMEGCEKIEDVKRRMAAGKLDPNERATIFTDLLDPEKQDGWPVPSVKDLSDECYSVVTAAADTTGNAMTIATFNALNNPEIYRKLREELIKAFPDDNARLSFQELEKLPYLTGVIKEGLRLSFGVPGRLPRVVPAGGATFNGHHIPEGYIVGMSSWMQHRNTDVWGPNPMVFNPEQWLDPVKFRELDRHIVAFCKGTRQCVGMPLAFSELYITLGTFFRRFEGLKVYETTQADLEFDDFFSSYHIYGRKWFKAVGPDFEKSKQ